METKSHPTTSQTEHKSEKSSAIVSILPDHNSNYRISGIDDNGLSFLTIEGALAYCKSHGLTVKT